MKTLFDKNLTLAEAKELIVQGADMSIENNNGLTLLDEMYFNFKSKAKCK